MNTAELKDRIKLWHAESCRLEAEIPALKEKLESFQAQLEDRSKSLTVAQSQLEQLKRDYQAECRKLASGESSKVVSLKQSIQEAEAKIEGLKQLVAEDQRAVAEARAPVDALETELATARLREKEASLFLKSEEALQRVSEQLLGLIEEVEIATRAANDVGVLGNTATYVRVQTTRLWRLNEHLRRAKAEFF